MAHEQEDPKNLLIVVIGLGSMVVLIATMYGLGSYYDILRDEQQQEKILGRDNPELKILRDREEHTLTTYAKLDKDGARVRIPIDDAMKRLAQRGRDAFPAIKPDPNAAVIAGAAAPAASASAAPGTAASAQPATANSGGTGPGGKGAGNEPPGAQHH